MNIKFFILFILLFSFVNAIDFSNSASYKMYEDISSTSDFYSTGSFSITASLPLSYDGVILTGDSLDDGAIVCEGTLSIDPSFSGTFSSLTGVVPIPTNSNYDDIPNCGSCPSSGTIKFNQNAKEVAKGYYSNLEYVNAVNSKYTVSRVVGEYVSNKQVLAGVSAYGAYYIDGTKYGFDQSYSKTFSTGDYSLSLSAEAKYLAVGVQSTDSSYSVHYYGDHSADGSSSFSPFNLNLGSKTINFKVVDQTEISNDVTIIVTPAPISFSNSQADVEVTVSLPSDIPLQISVDAQDPDNANNLAIISSSGNGAVYYPSNGYITATIDLTLEYSNNEPDTILFTTTIEGNTCDGYKSITSSSEVDVESSSMPNLVAEISGSNSLTIGESTELTIITTNTGDADADSSTTTLYSGNDKLASEQIDPLDPQQSQSFTYTFTCEQEGTYDITARADSNNEVEESNEQDNAYSFSIVCTNSSMPNLIATINSENSAYVGENITVTIITTNTGDADADSSTTTLYSGNDKLASEQIDPLDPQQSQSFTYTFTCEQEGTYDITARADSNNEVEESNEQDNAYSFSLQCIGNNVICDLHIQTEDNSDVSFSNLDSNSNYYIWATCSRNGEPIGNGDGDCSGYIISPFSWSSSNNAFVIQQLDSINDRSISLSTPDSGSSIITASAQAPDGTLQCQATASIPSEDYCKIVGTLIDIGQSNDFSVVCYSNNREVDCSNYAPFSWDLSNNLELLATDRDGLTASIQANYEGPYSIVVNSGTLSCSKDGEIGNIECIDFI